jgi:hypothetical protein
MARMRELVEAGVSVGTVESILGIQQGTLGRWLRKGQTDKRSAYHILFQKYRRWAGEARALAEMQQLAKTPTQWLQTNTSAQLVEPTSQTGLTNIEGPSAQNILGLGVQQTLQALKVLQESGISIDDAIRKGQLLPNLPMPNDSSN